MYSISGYGSMIADSIRNDAYARALRKTITPGSVVVDIGAGSGLFALLACQCGARRVYAIEPADTIYLAKEMAAANGYADRIEFIQDYSTAVTLPEQADVVVSDLRGVLPFFQQHLPSIIDARQRLLKTGGTLIPQQDSLWAAMAEAPELYNRLSAPWLSNPYGLDTRAGWRIASNTFRKGMALPEHLLVEPKCWACLDYRSIESPDVNGELTWNVNREGTAHGICAWFDTTLAEGAGFSNAPGLPELIYGNVFFPLTEPVNLEKGDAVIVRIHANLVGCDYIWRWETRVLGRGEPGCVKADFKQSTFFGTPLSPSRLRRQAESYEPELNEDGQIDQLILSLIERRIALGEIATQLNERFPQYFRDHLDALSRVGELSQKYSF